MGGIIVPVLGVIALVIVLMLALRKRSADARGDLGRRLETALSSRTDYRVFVGMPLGYPRDWVEVASVTKTGLVLKTGESVRYSDVTSAVVAYPNGQPLIQELGHLSYPPGIAGLDFSPNPESDLIQLSDLEEGNKYVRVAYGRSELEPDNPDHYSTALTNISGKLIRVVRFGGYIETSDGYRLYNATGAFYSEEEFRNWYNQGTSEWILPGRTVKDPNNYGSRPVIWAYHCVTEDGVEFVAGALLV